MITTADVTGPRILDEPDKVFLRLVANNGAESRFSLFSLNLRKIPQTVELHGRVYERDGNTSVFTEAHPAPVKADSKPIAK